MSRETRIALMNVRRALIALLNILDDALGLPRTIVSREDRRNQLTNMVE